MSVVVSLVFVRYLVRSFFRYRCIAFVRYFVR